MNFVILYQIVILSFIANVFGSNIVPILTLDPRLRSDNISSKDVKQASRRVRGFGPEASEFLPFIMLIDKDKDTSEYWRETEILSLVRTREADIDYDKCEQTRPDNSIVEFASRRTVRPICRSRIDHQLCPQCPHFNNHTECELFRESCRERKVHPFEYRTYCERRYGKWKTMFLPADYSQCRCCDECIFYRELDQSCMQDEYVFDADEFLPVTTIDFRAGCNPYWGHPEQEFKALRCDKVLRRCSGPDLNEPWKLEISTRDNRLDTRDIAIHEARLFMMIMTNSHVQLLDKDDSESFTICLGVPVTIPSLPNETLNLRRSYRFQPPTGGQDCPVTCRGYECHGGLVPEHQCAPGAYLPDKEECNCCGRCSAYQQLNQKCAEFKKTVHQINGTKEIEVEEEFLEPGCDDGLVCRQGRCQDIHIVQTTFGSRRRRDDSETTANEPCKRELKNFKKKYGEDGHLHFEAPQCTPLWLYAPVQCRRFVCYCALEDGTFIHGIKVPRVEVSNMNCDCAREKCRTGSDVECDGYGNYKEAVFTPHVDDWSNIASVAAADDKGSPTVPPGASSSDNPTV